MRRESNKSEERLALLSRRVCKNQISRFKYCFVDETLRIPRFLSYYYILRCEFKAIYLLRCIFSVRVFLMKIYVYLYYFFYIRFQQTMFNLRDQIMVDKTINLVIYQPY